MLTLLVETAFGRYGVGDTVGDPATVASTLLTNATDVVGVAIGSASPTSVPFTAGEILFFFGQGAPGGGLGGANCTYVDQVTTDLWVNNAGTWQNSGARLRGPANFAGTPEPGPLYVQPIAYAASLVVNGQLGRMFTTTLTGNSALGAPENISPGEKYFLEVKQDGTGSRLLTYTSPWKFAGGSATLSTTANATDVIEFVFDGTSYLGELTTGYA